MKLQNIIDITNDYGKLEAYFQQLGIKKLFLVCDSSLPFLKISAWFDETEQYGIELIKFSEFKPNPEYESVVEGLSVFHNSGSEAIMAVGGGSAMDVAKCIKLYSNMDDSENYLKQVIVPNEIPFIAMPTTAGTGSEATRYAVIYYEGEKQSITHESCIPQTVFFDASVVKTLPLYQKKSTMLDALCHAVESFWSINSNEESKGFSRKAIGLILEHKDGYLKGEEEACACMLEAAYTAGRAINITQTTAGHAMCYKITSLYNTAHGHSAALCLCKLWPYMLEHMNDCIDGRGQEYLEEVFHELAEAFDCNSSKEACQKFIDLYLSLELPVPKASKEELEILVKSVNPDRLKNHPIKLSAESIRMLYKEILSDDEFQ